MSIDRRSFIKAAVAGAGAAAIGGPTARAAVPSLNLTKPASTLLGGPPPRYPNVQNVVVMMMENRSTDHYLGWWGDQEDVRFDARTSLGPDGAPSGGRQAVNWGATGDPSFAQHRNYTGNGFGDPNHSHGGGRYQILDDDRDGIPDGWDKPNTGTDAYALSYYTEPDLPVIGRIVRDFTAFDRYFCSWMGNTFPNRYYMHSAQAHGIDNNDFPPQLASQNPAWLTGFDWPTLWDFLNVKGVTWKYYFSNLPAIALFGPRFLPNTRPITEYYADCAAGTLPQVCFVDPFFLQPQGVANDDHPHADIRLGQEFYSDVITAFLRSPHWAKGAMFINYDEWGGFWDHVVPPAFGTDVDPLATFGPDVDYTTEGPWTTASPADFGLTGFRTPAFLLSPYARNTGTNPVAGSGGQGRGHERSGGRGNGGAPADPTIDRTVSGIHDHTTILRFIAENWGLPDPGQWDPGFSRTPVNSMLEAFDPSIADPDDPGRPEVDVDAYEYVAPPEARTAAVPIPESSVSDLWAQADWIESMGYVINTRFADALPVTR